jgi:catechol 2,3-dioxygenase-like lactoylglutathione lyase family enzyme
MRNTMNTPMEPFDGAVLGLSGQVEASAHFVYDARGPRTSPAVEVQQWGSPALTGEPVSDPTVIGMQALGLGVADVNGAVAQLTARGCTVVGAGEASFIGSTWATVADPKGVRIDLVTDAELAAGASQMRHLRVNVADLERSLRWYDGLGFQLIDRRTIDDASMLGGAGAVDAEIARLRLPDEPFEALLIQWNDPAGHGNHPAEANHAGLFRAALGVDDTRAAHADLVEAGWSFDRAPIEVALNGTPVPDMVIAFLRDPDGVPFEFVQRPRSAFR